MSNRVATKENGFGSEVRALVEEFNTLLGDLTASPLADGVMQIGTLAISATAEKYKTTTTLYWRRLGIQFSKAATDNLTFGTAFTVNAAAGAGTAHWGAFLIEINDAGTTVKAVAVSSDQDYATEALAIAALPAADSGYTAIGYITVQAKTGGLTWTADTDDLTPTSDCTDANFYDVTALTPIGAISAKTVNA